MHPWETTLEFIASFPGDYSIQIAEDEDFSVGVVSRVVSTESDEVDAAGQYLLRTSLRLKPKTRYYWRVGPGRFVNDPESWPDCVLGTWTFKTAEIAAELEAFEDLGDGAFRTNFLGHVKVAVPPGTGYFASFFSSDEPPDCSGTPDRTFSNVEPITHYHVGTAFDDGGYVQTENGTQLPHYRASGPFPTEYLDTILDSGEVATPSAIAQLAPGEIGYLAILPGYTNSVEPRANVGTCSVFRLETTNLGPFGMDRARSDEQYADQLRLDYETGELLTGDFRFTESAGATKYRVRVNTLVQNDDGSWRRKKLFDMERKAGEGMTFDGSRFRFSPDNDDPAFLSRFGLGIPASSRTEPYYSWKVWAKNDYGEQRLAYANGLSTYGLSTPFAFLWNGVAWDPTKAVERHLKFEESSGVFLHEIDDYSHPREELVAYWSGQGVTGVASWHDVIFGFDGTKAQVDSRSNSIQVCVPKQVPFVKEVELYVSKLRADQIPSEDFESGPLHYQFATDQGQSGDTCTTIPVADSSTEATYFVMRSVSSVLEYSEWRAIRQQYIQAEKEREQSTEECSSPLSAPTPTSGAWIECLPTSTVLGRAPTSRHESLAIVEADCGPQRDIPIVKDMYLPIRKVSGAVRYVLGICGYEGNCNVEEFPGPGYLDASTPSEFGVSSPTDLYMISVFAEDECGKLGEGFYSAVYYGGEAAEMHSHCDYCCNDTDSNVCKETCLECEVRGCSWVVGSSHECAP